MHFNTLTIHVCVCIPLRLVLGKRWGLTAAHFQHSVSAENHPQTRPPYSAPAKRTIPTNKQRHQQSLSAIRTLLTWSRALADHVGGGGRLPPHSGIGPLWRRAWHFQRSSQPERRADPYLHGNPRHSMGMKMEKFKLSLRLPEVFLMETFYRFILFIIPQEQSIVLTVCASH